MKNMSIYSLLVSLLSVQAYGVSHDDTRPTRRGESQAYATSLLWHLQSQGEQIRRFINNEKEDAGEKKSKKAQSVSSAAGEIKSHVSMSHDVSNV